MFETTCVLDKKDIKEITKRLSRKSIILIIVIILLYLSAMFLLRMPVYITLTGSILLLAVMVLEQKLVIRKTVNATMEQIHEQERLFPAVYRPQKTYSFTDEGIRSAADVPLMGYSDIIGIYESKNFFILMHKGNILIPVRKDSIKGGTPDEFKAFVVNARKNNTK